MSNSINKYTSFEHFILITIREAQRRLPDCSQSMRVKISMTHTSLYRVFAMSNHSHSTFRSKDIAILSFVV